MIQYIAFRHHGRHANDWGQITDSICTDIEDCLTDITESLKADYPSSYFEATTGNIRVLVLDHETKIFDDKSEHFCAMANGRMFADRD